MSVMNDIAEARASALSLRASAGACSPAQGPLTFRLTRAADSLDGVVLIAVRGIERIEELEQELRKFQVPELTPTGEADVDDALRAVYNRLEHARQRVVEGLRAADRFDHAIVNIVLVMLDQQVAGELIDADVNMGRQLSRLRARLQSIVVSP